VVKIVSIIIIKDMIQVVNYEKMERLRAPPLTNVPVNLNTLSIIIVIVGLIYMYKRYITIKQSREQSRT
jgi:hypothetical protein